MANSNLVAKFIYVTASPIDLEWSPLQVAAGNSHRSVVIVYQDSITKEFSSYFTAVYPGTDANGRMYSAVRIGEYAPGNQEYRAEIWAMMIQGAQRGIDIGRMDFDLLQDVDAAWAAPIIRSLAQRALTMELTYFSDWWRGAYHNSNTYVQTLLEAIGGRVDGPVDWEGVEEWMAPGADHIYVELMPHTWCFAAGTQVLASGGELRSIETIRPGDQVLAFDPTGASSVLEPRSVVRIFEGVTETWIRLSNDLVVTPGHLFLTPDGEWNRIDQILESGGGVVTAEGAPTRVSGEYVHFAAGTAGLFEEVEWVAQAAAGNVAARRSVEFGWKTYNLEVEGHHTYVAGGLRVHNASLSENTLQDVRSAHSDEYITRQMQDDARILNMFDEIVDRQYRPDVAVFNQGIVGETYSQQEKSFRTDLIRQLHLVDGSILFAVAYRDAFGNVIIRDPLTGKTIDPRFVNGLPENLAQVHSSSYKDVSDSSGARVQLASGSHASVGQTWKSADGKYTYEVQADGSVRETGSGRTTSPATNGTTNPRQFDPVDGWTSSSYEDNNIAATQSLASSPVILDLNGNGVEVTTLQSSNFFFDVLGDGKQHRTAWAGAGDGVLVRDAGNDGVINLQNEIDFTEWDPTADGDLEALLNVFDTNHDGKLSADDADWALFKVLVTNPDGTTTLKTLAELGITSINLISNNQEVVFPDGSKIAGTVTYTKSDGSTGVAADAKLSFEAGGYVVTQTVTHNGDGSTTLVNRAMNADGSLGNETTTITSADGKTRTVKFDRDGDGVLDHVQTDVTATGGDGSVTRTIQDYDGSATILARKEVTLTSADGKTITVSRDVDGSGNYDEVETRATGGDGSLTLTVTHLNANGSTKDEYTTITSADGLSKAFQVELTGSGAINGTRTESTSVAGNGTRTETVTEYAGSGTAAGNMIGRAATVTTADGSSKTVSSDLDGNATVDLTSSSLIIRNGDGSTTTTQSHANGDSSLRDQTVTDLSADGHSKTQRIDLDGNGTDDVTITDVTVIGPDGATTRTITSKAANAATLGQTVATWSADGKTRSTSVDSDGDGTFDRIETVAVVSGNSVKTSSVHSPNGTTLLSRSVATTSANGLSQTMQVDANGDGTYDAITTLTTVINGDGSSTVTATSKNGDASVQIGKSITTTSADGLSVTTQTYLNAQATPFQTVTDVTVLNGNGSLTQTVTHFDGTNLVQTGKTVTNVSADRLTTTMSSYLNTNASPESTVTTVTNADGSKTQTASSYSPNGATLVAKSITTISADGLTKTTVMDANGDTVTDATEISAKSLNADGTTTTTTTLYQGSGTAGANKIGQTVVNTSGNGLVVTTQTDANGDGTFDAKLTSVTILNANGSTTQTVTSFNGAGTIQTGKTVTTLSDDGLSKTVSTYLGTHTTADEVITDTVVLNADGSKTETVSTFSSIGVLTARTVTTTSGNGLVATIASDIDGNGVNDLVVTSTTNADGSVTTVSSTYSAGGTLVSRSTQTAAGNGLSTTVSTDLDGNGVADNSKAGAIVLNVDGSTTQTVSSFNANGSLKEKTVVTTSADGLNVTTQWDKSGSGSFTGSRTDVTTVNADGSTTRVISNLNANGSLHDKTTIVTSADRQTVTTTEDINGNGTVDQTVIQTMNGDGTVLTSSMDGTVQSASGRSYGATRGMYETVSADGLTTTTRYDANGNGLAESQVTDTLVLNTDGSKVETIAYSTLTGGSASSANPTYTATLKDKAVVTTSANGLSTTTQFDLTGSGSFGESKTDVTVLNADGSSVETISNFAGATLKSRYAVTSSADGLSTTKQWDSAGTGSFTETSTDTVVINADGTTTETVTNTGSGGALISKVVTTTSADGRTTTVQKDMDGVGGFEASQTVAETTLADGTQVVTNSNFGASGTLQDKTVVQSSGDGRTMTVSRDANGDGIVDQTEVNTRLVDGSSSTVVTDWTANGTKAGQLTSITSADGLVVTSQRDLDGDGIVDRTTNRTYIDSADGSAGTTVQTYKVSETAANGTVTVITPVLQQTATTSVSADGRTVTSTVDVDGNGSVDETSITVTKINGSTVTTVIDNAAARAVAPSAGDVIWSSALATTYKTTAAASIIAVSADGNSKTVQADYDGNGTYEHAEAWKTRIDGSRVATITDKNGSGTTLASATQTISADGLTVTLAKDSENNGHIDHFETSVARTDGSKVKTVTDYNTDGTLKLSIVTTISSDGNELAYAITGGAINETLAGGDRDDFMDGGAGADTLVGGKGNDTYFVDNAGDVITENAEEGIDTVFSSIGYTIAGGVENLVLLGNGGNGHGNLGANTITGNDGNNTLSGSSILMLPDGSDVLIGKGGDDIYFILEDDIVIEEAGGGIDSLIVSMSAVSPAYLIPDHVENITVYSNPILFNFGFGNVIGNHLDNTITGGTWGNSLSGGDGNDTIDGGAGGADTLSGGQGADRLYGGVGNDTFLFVATSESIAGSMDRIEDFASGDKIKLIDIDANEGMGGDQAFALDANASFSAGEIRQTVVGSDLLLEMNVDADSTPEMSILIVGRTTNLTASDFIF